MKIETNMIKYEKTNMPNTQQTQVHCGAGRASVPRNIASASSTGELCQPHYHCHRDNDDHDDDGCKNDDDHEHDVCDVDEYADDAVALIMMTIMRITMMMAMMMIMDVVENKTVVVCGSLIELVIKMKKTFIQFYDGDDTDDNDGNGLEKY